MEIEKIKSIIESLLLAVGDPMKIVKIAMIIDVTEADVEQAIAALNEDYAAHRGFSIARITDSIQLVTNPENASFVSELIKGDLQENLSQAGLEVLAIVAYRGPISRAEIEAIRGVNCSFTLRSLLIRGLVEKVENSKDNRRYLYSISFDFLKKLGVSGVNMLPDWEALNCKTLPVESEIGAEAPAAELPEKEVDDKGGDQAEANL